MPGFNLVQKIRTGRARGGVAIYVRDNIKYKLRDDISIFCEGEFESVFIEIINDTRNTIVGEVYRVPNTDERKSIEMFDNIINKIQQTNKHVIIGTDQNFDYLKLSEHKNTSDLLDCFVGGGLVPCVTRPTRVTHSSATLIDNIYISAEYYKECFSGILINDMSDHFPLIAGVACKTDNKKEPLTFKSRKFTDETFRNMEQCLNQVDWEFLNNDNIDNAYCAFIDKLKECIDLNAPEEITSIPYNKIIREPWVTKGILKSSSVLSKLYRKKKRHEPGHEATIHYNRYRNVFNITKRKARELYYSNLLHQARDDIKKTWRILSPLIGKQKHKEPILNEFLINNEIVTNSDTISNSFSTFFANVGKNLQSSIPRSVNAYESYLNTDRPTNSVFFNPVTEYEVQCVLNEIKNKKSTGHEGISNFILKNIGGSILKPLCNLINMSLVSGYVPDILKVAKILPLYKNKEKNLLNNYWPVSLLPSLSKILEKVVHKRVYTFLNENNRLYQKQNGFRKKNSTIDAVTECVKDTLLA